MTRARNKKDLTPEEKRAQALVPPEEQPYEVPGNWRWVRVGAISSLHRGVSYKKSEEHKTCLPNDCLILRGGNVKEGYIEFGQDDIFVDRSLVSDEQIVRKNDVIIVASTGSAKVIGRTGISITNYTDVAFGAFLMLLRPCNQSDPRYLGYFFQSSEYRNRIKILASGVNINNIRADYITDTPCPLPPLSEQNRIIDRIERLFAALDTAKEKAQSVLASCEVRKAAILHKAFTGELTAEWRKNNSQSASWKTLQWNDFLINVEAGKNWSAEERPPQVDEFGVIKVSAVTWGTFNELASKTCLLAEQWNNNIQIHAGDFLFSRANTIQLVGNCVIVGNITKKLMLSDKILRFTFNKQVIPEYILYFTRSDLYRKQIEQLASGNQDGMRNISQKNFRLVEFPIPSLEEQKAIVSLLSNYLQKNETIKTLVQCVIKRIDSLKHSILARAFRSELGTNDPAEPPAELPV